MSDWKPYTEPPDSDRLVMFRFGECEKTDWFGRYFADLGGYARNRQRAVDLRFVHPTHWREMREGEA